MLSKPLDLVFYAGDQYLWSCALPEIPQAGNFCCLKGVNYRVLNVFFVLDFKQIRVQLLEDIRSPKYPGQRDDLKQWRCWESSKGRSKGKK